MNKKEILEKSRKENEGQLDERELQINANASKFGMAVGGILSIVILSKIFNIPLLGMAAWAVYFSMYGTRHLYNYIFTHDKIELFQTIVGILFGSACFLGMTVLLIK